MLETTNDVVHLFIPTGFPRPRSPSEISWETLQLQGFCNRNRTLVVLLLNQLPQQELTRLEDRRRRRRRLLLLLQCALSAAFAGGADLRPRLPGGRSGERLVASGGRPAGARHASAAAAGVLGAGLPRAAADLEARAAAGPQQQ
jgi:hypothetical protein